ncbi:movement protein [Soymovirus malvae]|nr:movement protein [Malva associated soymovirus 1]
MDQNNLTQEIEEISEDNRGYFSNCLIDKNKIAKADFDLREKDNFLQKGFSLKNCFNRENILYFGIMTGEQYIASEETEGDVELSIINEEQICDKLRKIKNGSKITTIHISTIQFILKSTYKKGIDSPIKMEILDKRFLDKEKQILATGNCNLSQGKIKFDLRLMIGMSLRDRLLNESITLRYKAEKQFKNENNPFSISYRVNYAVSNSHHSIEFKDAERIHINELFTPLVDLKSQEKMGLLKIRNPKDRLIRSNSIRKELPPTLTEPLREFREQREDPVKELKDLVISMSKRL